MVGLTSNKSFKIKGEIRGHDILVLVDNDASTNFMATKLTVELQLPMTRITSLTIEVGNGQKEKGTRVCHGVKLAVQGLDITQHFFLIELGGTKVILGMGWLSSLGKIEANFKELHLKWMRKGKFCEL